MESWDDHNGGADAGVYPSVVVGGVCSHGVALISLFVRPLFVGRYGSSGGFTCRTNRTDDHDEKEGEVGRSLSEDCHVHSRQVGVGDPGGWMLV